VSTSAYLGHYAEPFASWTIPLRARMRLTPAPEARRAARSYSVPGFCLALSLGSHYSPGYFSDAIRIDGVSSSLHRNLCLFSPRPFWTKPITRVGLSTFDDDSNVGSFSTPAQLCSAEFLVEFKVTAFHSPFTD